MDKPEAAQTFLSDAGMTSAKSLLVDIKSHRCRSHQCYISRLNGIHKYQTGTLQCSQEQAGLSSASVNQTTSKVRDECIWWFVVEANLICTLNHVLLGDKTGQVYITYVCTVSTYLPTYSPRCCSHNITDYLPVLAIYWSE